MMSASGLAVCALCGAEVDPQQSQVWIRDNHPIARCGACGLLFRVDLPTPEDLRSLYSTRYFHSEGQDANGQGYPNYLAGGELHRRNARRRLDFLAQFVPTGRLLDVGCAAGFFLDEARRRGWTVTGVELAPSMAAFGRNHLKLDIREAAFANVALPAEHFDCVTMWDYIEHSLDPVADLRHARDLLRPEGTLALSTGDAASTVARVSGRRWHLLTPEHHNFFFTRSTLRRALEEAGLQVRRIGTLASQYSVHYLAHKLQTMSRLSLLRGLARRLEGSRLGLIPVPLNLFDIMIVIAEKPAA